MYEKFYGLMESPFNLTPDPAFLFLNETFRKALEEVADGVDRREAFTVVTGDVGTGKTTLCWALLLRLKPEVRTALLLNPLLDPDDMLRAIIQDFGIVPGGRVSPRRSTILGRTREGPDPSWMQGLTPEQLLDELGGFLLDGASKGLISVLVIDEAQDLSPEVLERLRILSKLEIPGQRLLQTILVGQLELDQKLNLPELSRLKQKIGIRCELRPLCREDMDRYIYHRLWVVAGKKTVTFDEAAFKLIYKCSRGYPRLINMICDRALLTGYRERSQLITAPMVQKALHDLGMSEPRARRFAWAGSRKRILAGAGAVLALGLTLALTVRSGNVLSGFFRTREPAAPEAMAGRVEPAVAAQAPKAPDLTPAAAEASAAAPSPAAPPTTATTSEPAVRSGPGYLLQVHSLDTEGKAARAVVDLEQKGYPALQRAVRDAGGTRWHVVYVGPFDELKTAEDAARTLRMREQLESILRPPFPSKD